MGKKINRRKMKIPVSDINYNLYTSNTVWFQWSGGLFNSLIIELILSIEGEFSMIVKEDIA